MHKPNPTLYLAPLKGLTDAIFRETFTRHFKGMDLAIAPFISPQKTSNYPDNMLQDVLPEKNPNLPVIPQILQTDAESFIVLANRLAELGYQEVNWNLGCPAPMVAKKKRGCGLLPYPETILDLLNQILPRINVKLSIKTRLGYREDGELIHLLPQLDQLPLTEIIIHPRLGSQLYRGLADPESFSRCMEVTRHRLVYNGDIVDSTTYSRLALRFPEVKRWMIGRGLLCNPFLAEEIRSLSNSAEEDRNKRLLAFHEELFHRYEERLDGPGHLLGRMKPIWIYLINSFPEQKKLLKKVLRCKSVPVYLETVERIFAGRKQ